jgi:glyoxylase-like metal-dependent hydrolase (beta-lactamase superfamily II)
MTRTAAAGVATILGALLWAAAPHTQSPGQARPPFRLYILDCGRMAQRDGVAYGLSREQLPPRDLSNPCALVVHPRGTLLWETGLHESVNTTPADAEPRPGRPRAGDRVERTLKSQLEEIGYQVSDVTYLALSHSHWDHTGNARDYLEATWLVQRPEHEAVFGDSPLPNRGDFAGLRDSQTRVLDGDYDVFGDSTVTLLFTPGHTPGHQALLVRLPNTGPVILSGDLYHFPEELTLETAPGGRNADRIATSKQKIQTLIETMGARLWIQHDSLGYAELQKAPAYYD